MSQTTWNAVDDYFNQHLLADDPTLEAILKNSDEAGLPQIAVAPNQGKLLHMMARIQGARNILEIGTLGGYSTVWLARALPADGKLTTLEYDPTHAAVARRNFELAGVSNQIDVRVGPALDNLPQLVDQAPFDFIFIDADKPNNPAYFQWAMRLGRPGTVIILDNVVRDGEVIQADSPDDRVQGVRQFTELVASTPNVVATALQTVGHKGYDGFVMLVMT